MLHKIKVIIGIIAISGTIYSCSADHKNSNKLIDQLNHIKGDGILFGHQDDLAYGVEWGYIKGESDVKRVTGDYPALFGWELGGLEQGEDHNLDKVPFNYMIDMIKFGDKIGGINTISWHPFSVIDDKSSWETDSRVVEHIIPGGSHHDLFKKDLDKVADFMLALKRENGEPIPFIFRPWHEMDGKWFWWGSSHCTVDQFKELFKFTVKYLREDKGVTSMVIAYSPDRNFESKEEYLTWYPGDNFVDILGMDNYHDLKQKGGEIAAIEKLHIVIEEAKAREKLSAFTETGISNVTDPTWYTQRLGKVLADPIVKSEISYVMVWRNDPKVHFFFPYPKHAGADDARELLDRKEILLLEDFKRLKK